MLSVAEREAIGSLFMQGWTNGVPVAVPNAKFDPAGLTEYVRLSILRASTDQIEIGGIKNTDRAEGAVIVSVFTPKDGGDARARQLCDEVSAIFHGQRVLVGTVGSILFRRASSRDAAGDGKFYQFNVTIPYQFDYLL